jgi:hypothetical protein
MRRVAILCVLITLTITGSSIAAAQTTQAVTSADIARLDTTVTEIRNRLVTLKPVDPTGAAEIQKRLTEIEEDVTYLRVKFRKEGAVTRQEYDAVRDRLETLRIKAQGKPLEDIPAKVKGDGKAYVFPVGTVLEVRLQTALNSGTAKPEDRFEATTLVPYPDDRDVYIPAGSLVRGFVSSVRAAGRIDRKGSLTLSFDELRIENTSLRLRASVIEALDAKAREDVTRIGAGGAVGAVIGGIIGGMRGALIGVLVGAGGTIAATEGSDVDLPIGTILKIRLDQPLEIIRASTNDNR